MGSKFDFNERKFRELIVYFAHRLEPSAALGRVKLAKLLMHSDFNAFARHGAPITGATYEKWEHGHLPRQLLMTQRDLEADGSILVQAVNYYGLPLKHIAAQRDPDMSEFSEDELAVIEGAVRQYGYESAGYLSAQSHREPGWDLADWKETIPYSTGLIGTERPSESVFALFRELHDVA